MLRCLKNQYFPEPPDLTGVFFPYLGISYQTNEVLFGANPLPWVSVTVEKSNYLWICTFYTSTRIKMGANLYSPEVLGVGESDFLCMSAHLILN